MQLKGGRFLLQGPRFLFFRPIGSPCRPIGSRTGPPFPVTGALVYCLLVGRVPLRISEAQSWRKRDMTHQCSHEGLPRVLASAHASVHESAHKSWLSRVPIIPYKGSHSSAHVSAHAGAHASVHRSGLVVCHLVCFHLLCFYLPRQ